MARKKEPQLKKLSTDEAVQMIYKRVYTDMATKEDLADAKSELREEIAILRNETNHGFDLVRMEMGHSVSLMMSNFDSIAHRVKRLEEKVFRR